MERGNTKQQILDAALELFSIGGFEATSISQIADAVGIRKASLYSHFAGKQDILDCLIDQILAHYEEHSIFAGANWDDPSFTEGMEKMDGEKAAKMLMGQVRYIVHDPEVSRARKMLVIGQFQNPRLAQLQSKQNYGDILRFHTGMMRFLIREQVLFGEDPTIMAAQLSLPISVWINLCDREPEREEEVMGLIHRHVISFFNLYKKEK